MEKNKAKKPLPLFDNLAHSEEEIPALPSLFIDDFNIYIYSTL
jgi:hypothetical protein